MKGLLNSRAGKIKMFDFLIQPFIWFLELLNDFFGSYPLTLLVFTVLINVVLLPLNIKQQRTTAKQARLKPKLEEIKERCGTDRQKYQVEMSELYQREKVSPAGGCLPLLLRMVILIAVYQAIRDMIGISNTNELLSSNDPAYLLFGLNTSVTPQFSTNILGAFKSGQAIYWLIPLLSLVASWISMVITQAQQKATNPDMQAAAGSMKMMLYIMPFMSLVIAFSVPGLVGFYWICSNVVTTTIQLLMNKFYSTDRVLALEILKSGKARRTFEKNSKS